MSAKATKIMLAAYFQDAMPTMFLASFFRTPPQNFHDTESVEIDIERHGEDIATVITDLTTGGNVNSFDGFTNKEFKPPVYMEKAGLNAFELLGRDAGDTPFDSPQFNAKAIMRAMKQFRVLEAKVRRGVELQASQVLQTGTLTLLNAAGVSAYVLDYKPKPTHFPTSSTTWGQAGDDKLGDLAALAEVNRSDGLSNSDNLIFGDKAWDEFKKDAAVVELLNSRRMELGAVVPQTRGQGATYQGYIWIGSYRFDMWTYNGRYKHPQTGEATRYLNTGSVVMLDSQARLDLSFGSIPFIQTPTRQLAGLPRRMNNSGSGFGMTTNSWVDNSGTNLNVSAGTRPLCIPTAIDTFGCLDTGLV